MNGTFVRAIATNPAFDDAWVVPKRGITSDTAFWVEVSGPGVAAASYVDL
jgi:hypothetical protein